MAVSDRYATFANFGGGYTDSSSRPQIKKVVIAECIKRRLPSKHYVYKMVVDWTTGTTSIVYRRYSMFFDFQVKLQELYLNVCQRNPQFVEKVPHLPELPGKILFGRSHIHQVAEKRRGKIEEFCQQVVSLPSEISNTNLVMGFFNTWPDDTMLPLHSESVTSSTSSYASSFTSSGTSTLSPTNLLSPTSPTTPSTLTHNSTPFVSSSATEAVISHPDEMENLEQYSVLADYRRKDSHQVNLTEGQVVHVIEKHDTGWWMVMSEDEQGYAPAAYLEPVEGGGGKRVTEQVMEENSGTSEEYEAMESYNAQNEDEVDFRVGDKVTVISKSLDGWWKIRCYGKVGLAPSALIRKRMTPQLPRDDVIYESHKSIYEGLNIHKPPPRRNTVDRNYNHLAFKQVEYAVPRSNPRMSDDIMSGEDDCDHDYAEPPLELTSEDEDDPGYYRVPRPLQSSMSNASSSSKPSGNLFSPPPRHDEGSVRHHGTFSPTSTQRDSTDSEPPIFPTPIVNFSKLPQEKEEADNGGGIYEMVPEESPYEIDPAFCNGSLPPSSFPPSTIPLYQNTDDARFEVETFKSSRSSGDLGSAGGGSVVQGESSSRRSPSSSAATSPPPHSNTPSSTQCGEGRDDDYVDIDQHDEYVDPDELIGGDGGSSTGDPPTPASPSALYDLYKPLPKPPLPTSDPPKKKPKMAKSKSLIMDLSEIVEDEYIPMEPIYTEPPQEELSQSNGANAQQQKQQKQQKPPTPSTPSSSSSVASSSFSFFSSSPSPQGKLKKPYLKLKVSRDKVQISSPVLVEKNGGGLTRAKSLEDILTSNSSRESSPQRLGSPQSERKASPGRVPMLPPVPAGGGGGGGRGRGSGDHQPGESRGFKSVLKSKPGKVKTGKAKRNSELNIPHHMLQSSSPPPGTSTEHRSITHTTSVPTMPPPWQGGGGRMVKESVHLTTYVALSNYQSQQTSCLSFQAGDKCVLLRKTTDGWWLVNIGGREGWTPEGCWREEAWNQTSTIARPPGPAPSVAPPQPPEIKPRSHTVATDFSSSQGVSSTSPVLELTSSMEGSMETSHSSWGGSVEVDRQPSSREASEGSKPTPPPPPPQSTKPGRREPPQPKPKPSLANTPMRKKADKKPPVPQKPNNIPPVPQKPGNTPPVPQKPSNIPPVTQAPVSRSSPSSSPPLPRRLNEDNRTPSPLPPLLLPPASGQRKVDETESNNQEYVMLENTSTMDPLESSSWFVGKMERVSAEQFLMEHGRQREFLVRERTARDGYYALSIRYHYSCKHFNIDPTPEGEYAIGNLTFPTISDIVHHYQNNSLFIHENQHVTLSVPARRRTRGTDMRIHS